ncbi:MAG: Flp family type IVb pilin [Hyphomicrobiales bacterium]|uniref:Flp family type IVb pilin n=1 Tax=Aestuariivirga sp. TaxID=2650926 RepID=UPI0035B18BAD
MKSIASFVRAFSEDENGAAFIEYTALLGVILVVALAILNIVGSWANTRWNRLASSMNATP